MAESSAMKFSRQLLGLVLLATLASAPALLSSPQSPAIPPPPPPNLSLVPPVDAGPVATIGFANSTSVRTRSSGGQFRLTGIRPNETISIRLQFPVSLASAPLLATALDGGEANVQGQRSLIAADGTISVRFKAGGQPGLYRVLVVAATNRSLLKFWVPDPKNPKGTPPVLQPGS
ncbi:MAG: hypothetical protein V7609_146 [Verrucomicrobiota bacterium]